jgi:hypothetical protein
LAIAGGYFSGLKRMWLAASVPVVLAPMIFAGLFWVFSLLREASTVTGAEFRTTAAAAQFYPYVMSLVIYGFITGAVLGGFLTWFSKRKHRG